jgi:hypothetical protein
MDEKVADHLISIQVPKVKYARTHPDLQPHDAKNTVAQSDRQCREAAYAIKNFNAVGGFGLTGYDARNLP